MSSDREPGLPLPQATAETAAYWEAARGGKLVIQRCRACNHRQFYPRAFCTSCLSDEIEWMEASGLGTIYSYTVCRIAANSAFEPRLPLPVAMIDLDEGVRMLANIVDADIDRIAVRARVAVCFERVDETCTLPQFKLGG
jgi:uncharacterized OB-fold protein